MEIEAVIEEVTKRILSQIEPEQAEVLILAEEPQPELEQAIGRKCVYFSQGKLLSYETLVSPFMCVSGLCNLSRGMYDGPFQKAFLDALLQGKSVIQIREGMEYRKYIDTMPKALLAKYLSCERELESMGVRIASLSELGRQEKKMGKRLLTAKDLEGCAGQVTVDKDCIVTALAMDYIQEHHIVLIRS